MPESRDRLSKPDEVTTIFARRRRAIRGLDILSEEAAERSSGGTPFRWGTTPMTGGQRLVGVMAATGRPGGEVWRGSFGTPRSATRRGSENFRPGSVRRGRGRGSILPSWYPRAPLRDITSVARAIERRRGSSGETQGLQLQTPTPLQRQIIHEPCAEFTPNAQLKYISVKSSNHAAGKNSCPCPPSVAKILRNITNQKAEGGNLECLTPQKKLLNYIDVVGKAVIEELEKIKKTPSAKRAIREKKIQTLMSMR